MRRASLFVHVIACSQRHRGDQPPHGRHPDQAGAVTLVTFKLAGQEFRALNGGPQYESNETVSLFVECETQRENRRALEQALRR
jgi:predicted 3-demethylubiquinone-9 3-methyltransferase (glyoxalase superfamily)